MSTSIIIALGIVAYILIGCVVNAALRCFLADETGYVSYDKRDTAALCSVFWPVAAPFALLAKGLAKLFDGMAWVSRKLFIICYRRKHGRNPNYY